jgi:transglutaminase-like putative cysteine protease
MSIGRREFLMGGAALSALAIMPKGARADAASFAPKAAGWRRFEIMTRMEIKAPEGTTQAWIPLPAINQADWIRPMGSLWSANTLDAVQVRDARSGAEMLHVAWAAGEQRPVVEVTSRFAARDRSLDLTKPQTVPALSAESRRHYTRATSLIPTGGIVKQTSDKIVAGARSDIEKARRIYEWIVENCYRDAKVRGCGIGDVASMLQTGNLGGKCADLNALYVGLARSQGMPARDLYGIRVAASQFGYKSLGANSADITTAQHCRAEVWLESFGWTPVDPADVRKVALEEPPGNRAINDEMVAAARKALFGAWETNWLAYNDGHDVALPGSNEKPLGFLMYPQAETASGLLDCCDPETVAYSIHAREITA